MFSTHKLPRGLHKYHTHNYNASDHTREVQVVSLPRRVKDINSQRTLPVEVKRIIIHMFHPITEYEVDRRSVQGVK